ncbi:MAG: hypothetical protein GY832_03855 [Chloroflexi bacterium]|nr:hypothetical protein [Chloroflexota bacterium]
MGATLNGASDQQKIDSATTLGLLGTNNALAYRTHEVERHLHSYERWLGAAAAPSGETHVADHMHDAPTAAAFQIDAGNNDWGAWVQIIGSSDTPVDTGNVKFDFHRVQFVECERTALYWVQIAFGATAAGAVTDGDFVLIPLEPQSAKAEEFPVETQTRRKSVGTKTWARCICPGQDTATLDFYLGLHEYEG